MIKQPTTRETVLLSSLLLIVLIAGLLRLNDLSLYTDSTRYVIWAHSLSTANGFVDNTNPIPSSFVMNAPLFPILLAPSQWFAGMSVLAAKIWTLLWGLLALALFYFWFRRRFGIPSSLTATAFLAASPLFLFLSTEVLSEAPFMAFLMATLYALDLWSENPNRPAINLTLVGLLILLPLLREVGFAAAGAASIAFLMKKSTREFRLLVGGIFVLYLAWTIRNILSIDVMEQGQASNVQYLFQHFVTSPDQPIVTEMVTRMWVNVQGYVIRLGGALFYPFPTDLVVHPSGLYDSANRLLTGLMPVVTVLGLGTLGAGMFLDLQEESSGLFRPLFILFFVLILLLYPVHELRFLFPLIPLLLFYSLLVIRSIIQRFLPDRNLHPSLTIVIGIMLILPNAICSVEMVRTNLRYTDDPLEMADEVRAEGSTSYYTRPWSVFAQNILSLVPEDAVIASPAKEIAPFLYPRKVLELSRTVPAPQFERTLRDFGVRFLIGVTTWEDFQSYEFATREARRVWLQPLLEQGGLTLFGVHSTILEPIHESRKPATDYTTSAPDLLRSGRQKLLDLDFAGAIETLERAIIQAPNRPEIAAQLAIAHSIRGDSVLASAVAQILFTMPQSTAHNTQVQVHLDLMSRLLMARSISAPSVRSAVAVGAAQAYWDLGYRQLALRIIQNVLFLDPKHFEGLMWGSYYSRELGDTAASRRFLADLKYVDITADIIPVLDRIEAILEEIGKASSTAERCSLHTDLADTYRKLELFENALDETERSIALDPQYREAWNLRREIFVEKGAMIGAEITLAQMQSRFRSEM